MEARHSQILEEQLDTMRQALEEQLTLAIGRSVLAEWVGLWAIVGGNHG